MAEIRDSKAELSARLARARAQFTGHSRGAGAHLHPSTHIRAAYQRQRTGWLGGAALLGLLISKIPPRTKNVVVGGRGAAGAYPMATAGKAGFFLGMVKLALDLLKPILIAWATKRMGDVARSTERTEKKVERTEDKVERTEAKVAKVDRKT